LPSSQPENSSLGGRITCTSDGGLRAHAEDKLVGLGLDDLLGEVEVGERVHGHEEGELSLPKLEEGAGPDGAGEEGITDEGPPLHLRQLPVILLHKGGSMVRKRKDDL